MLPLLLFNTCERDSGGGQNETLCALGKAGKTGLQIDISGADFMSPILIYPLSREAQKSFMMTTVPHD